MKTRLPLALLATALPAHARTDILPVKQIGLELARDIAMASVEICRRDGYKVSTVVLDRACSVQAALRDMLTARHTQKIAERKARMTIMSGTYSGEFRAAGSLIVPSGCRARQAAKKTRPCRRCAEEN